MAFTVALSDMSMNNSAYDHDDFHDGLWRQAPFTRLPPNAPPELRDYVQEIRSPKRSYAVHSASRRHDFQTLVARFMIQLRDGCDNPNCNRSSCFTCRMRLAGTRPIRRYSFASARILAVYMAGCQNPYDHLCTALLLDRTKGTAETPHGKRSDPLTSLAVTQANTPAGPASDETRPQQHTSTLGVEVHPRPQHHHITSSPFHGGEYATVPTKAEGKGADVTIREEPTSKDHRSFAAATFETLAFKMMQWLTPGGVHQLSMQMFEVAAGIRDGSPKAPDQTLNGCKSAGHTSSTKYPPRLKSPPTRREVTQVPLLHQPEPSRESRPPWRSAAKMSDLARVASSSSDEVKERRRSTGSLILSPMLRDGLALRSRRAGLQSGSGSVRSRRSSSGFEGVSRSDSPPSRVDRAPHPSDTGGGLASNTVECHDSHCVGQPPASARPEAQVEGSVDTSDKGDGLEADKMVQQMDYQRPQTLARFSPAIIDFLCDVYSEDSAAECLQTFSCKARSNEPTYRLKGRKLARQWSGQQPKVDSLLWKAFSDQAAFTVLSDPHALLASFTSNGKLLDSHTIWYCMVRLTRAVPDLVFHSVWLAAEALFVPRQNLRHAQLRDGRPWQKGPALSLSDAGRLMSICLHTLVAAVPIVNDSRTLYELSRIRANGHVLASNASNSKQTHALYLEYDDVFTNELALRLARRLFLAVSIRWRCHDSPKAQGYGPKSSNRDALLEPIFTQLDFMTGDTDSELEFTPADRLLHETRVPTLLLDWARAVLMASWDGQPCFSENSAFGGAMSFIASMYRRRNSLLLGDIQFRLDYFSERLTSVEMAVNWTSSRMRPGVGHILDHPYLFTSEALVSFFRSINFSRMTSTFEESSSLQTRMEAIVQPGSLITNPHHKFVLQDLLKTASAKYLILNIRRGQVLQDTFDQLWRREQRELLRPLKVHLGEDGGEEGFDSGGVQQEFFRMAISECLDPSFGAFSVDERTRMAWFVPGSVVEAWRFELMGVLMSLALYNGLTLPVTFPRALYRKLLNTPVLELHHIADGWPDLVSGLTTLLEWDEKNGFVEDVFARTYDFSISAFGRHISRDMKKHDGAWPPSLSTDDDEDDQRQPEDESVLVTNANRDEYVSDYIQYLTDVSIRPQFQAFEQGFRRCLSSQSLELLSPSILQSLVEGIQDIDVSELRRNTRYVGWDASHRTIKDFWSVVRKYDIDMRRRLLEFVTASDRVPVGGIRNMQFVIQKNGEEVGARGRLPTAYTCYGTLLLPEYTDKDILKERLGMALENAQGFGFA